ncbi:MAG: isochorismate synthase [bacterium]|nr:isochorismate synthase [bacterium]
MSLPVRSVLFETSELPPERLRSPSFAWMIGDFSLEGYGEAWRFDPGVGEGRFQRAREAWGDWLAGVEVDDRVSEAGSGPVGFASFTFDPESPGSVVAVPAVVVGRRAGRSWITVTGDGGFPLSATRSAPGAGPPDRPRYVGPSHPDWEWMESVARALRLIEAGRLQKVVLARDVEVWSKSPFGVRRLLRRLHHSFPGCFTFLVDGLVGASPELLLKQSGRRVESVALAGTAPRHPDPARDEQLARRLLESEKDLREHDLTARSVERSLREVCARLDRNTEPTLRDLVNLRHLSTRFTGLLSEGLSSFEVVHRLHPTAAVGGVPRQGAMEAIAGLEGIDRGRYAGPVGWFDLAGDAQWAVALRCAQLNQTGARLYAGAGIVAGSLPEEELAETRLKLRTMTNALDLRS